MIKEVEVTEKTIKRYKYCDDCGKKIERSMACSVATCKYCGKDLCDKCVAAEDSTMGDYRTVYCSKCYDIKTEYDKLIEPLENEIERLSDEMIDKCKKHRFKIK